MQSVIPDRAAGRVQALFEAASELDDGGHLDSFLAQECGGDLLLRRVVENLLAASREALASPLWQRPAIHHEARRMADVLSPVQMNIAGYRLMERIGSGGMGVVYRAIRADETFEKVVAVKIVHPAPEGSFLARRFHQERQILAGLDHPNIVRLLDGGTTPEGFPFLVMEYVEGQHVDKYLAERNPSVQEILRFFAVICSAVSYAHQNLIVHRDLKPGNILVTSDGTPKLLDFGIAKLLDAPDNTAFTRTAALTAAYASPEQIRNQPVTVAADVYSLGVLLYQALTSVSPYPDVSDPVVTAISVCTHQPAPPSVRAGRRISRDLDNIVLKALRKEPERRYSSVDQFAEDIRRLQEGFPVIARPDTALYRASKFIRRNRWPLSLAATATFIVLALAAGLFVQWRHAQRRLEDVRAISDALIFNVYDSIRDLPGALPARTQVASIAQQYLDRVTASDVPDSALRLELATAYRKLGDIQGEPYTSNLGDSARALANYQKALRLLQDSAHANTAELAVVYQQIGRIYVRQGHPEIGEQAQHKALAIFERIARAHPHHLGANLSLGSVEIYLGQSLYIAAVPRHSIAGLQQAFACYKRASDQFRSLLSDHPNDPAVLFGLGHAEGHMAYALWSLGQETHDRRLFQTAVEDTARAVNAEERAADLSPNSFRMQWAAANAYADLGRSQQLNGKALESIENLSKCLERLQRLAAREPMNREIRRDIAQTYFNLGASLVHIDSRKATLNYGLAVTQLDGFLRSDPSSTENVRDAVNARNGLAQVDRRLGRYSDAQRLYRKAIVILTRADLNGSELREENALLAAIASR